MNLEVFKRNVQLFKLGIAKLEDDDKKVYGFLIENLSGLSVYKVYKDSYFLYFGKSTNSIVLRYDSIAKSVCFNHDMTYGSMGLNKLTPYMDFDGVKSIISWWVGLSFNLKIENIEDSWFEVDSHALKPYHDLIEQL